MRALNLLLVEDHRELAATTGAYLESCGHAVDCAESGLVALHLAAANDYDVMVLDIMIPGPDGLSVCRRLRRDAQRMTPIILLTARDRLDDKLEGFRAGADDYLVKPFDMPELVARIEAVARRRHGAAARLAVGELVLDVESRQVARAGRPVTLSKSAFTLLALLMREYPRVVSRRAIERALWEGDPPNSDALRSHLYNLRQAVDRPFDSSMVCTVTGCGYCIRIPEPVV